ncbi:hypothetical protein EC991_004055 [Linnemannia zychae]|nr:hypothetical protein EC991_004055 [Linnemannia zychae]
METIQVQASYKITLSSGVLLSRSLPMHLDRTTPMSELRAVLSENVNEQDRSTLGFVVITKVSDNKGKELPLIGVVRDHVENEEVLLLEGRVLSRKDIEADALSWNCRSTASLLQEVAPLSVSSQASVLGPQFVPALITQLVPALVPQLVTALTPQLLAALGSVSTPAMTRNREADWKTQEDTDMVQEISKTKESAERKEPVVIKETLAPKETFPKPLGLDSSILELSTSPLSVSSTVVSSSTPSSASARPLTRALASDSDSSSDSDDEDDQLTPIDNKRKVEFPDNSPKRPRISSPSTTSSNDGTDTPSDDSDSDEEDAAKDGSLAGAIDDNSGAHLREASVSDSDSDEEDAEKGDSGAHLRDISVSDTDSGEEDVVKSGTLTGDINGISGVRPREASTSDSEDEDQPTTIGSEHKIEIPASPPKQPQISSAAMSPSSDDSDTSSSSDDSDSDSDEEDTRKGSSLADAFKEDSGARPQDTLSQSFSPRMNVPAPPITLTELCRRMAAEKATGSLELALKREESRSQGSTKVAQSSASASSRRRRGPLEALFD